MSPRWKPLSLLRGPGATTGSMTSPRDAPVSVVLRSFHTSSSRTNRCRVLEDIVIDPSASSSTATTTDILRPFFEAQKPVRLRQFLMAFEKSAHAMTTWQDWDHFERTVDGRTPCHVEVGGNYSQSDLANVEFRDFLAYLRFFQDKYGARPRNPSYDRDDNNAKGSDQPQPGELMYLAQNDLFPELLRELEGDVPPPFRTQLGQGHVYNTMIWMGPYGCVSPLHWDPLDNCLLQFVGQKLVWLCSPDSPVGAGSQGRQSNTSPINPEQVYDEQDHNNNNSGEEQATTCSTTFFHSTLNPGDALYVPKKWYHYVRTTETSVSVNTWWR